jgi:COMPASS component SWD3
VACRFAPTQPWVVTGGVDRSVRITDYESGVQVCQLSGVFPAPVLAVDVNPAHPELLAVSCMDGAHLIVDHAARRVVQQWKDHSKYVTRVRWSRNGRLLITASHDHSAKLYG